MFSRENGDSRPNGLMDYLNFHELLPTPTAGEAEKYRLKYTPGSQMGQSLSAMGASGMLPTPISRDWKGMEGRNYKDLKEGKEVTNTLPAVMNTLLSAQEDSIPKQDGPAFRLSPLFTEEMMGFPFLWTTLPFLQQSGEQNPSKPTETP